jgi:hypothetical protein
MAVAMAMKHHLWLLCGSHELLNIDTTTAPYGDCNSAIGVEYNPKSSNQQTNNIEVGYLNNRAQIH